VAQRSVGISSGVTTVPYTVCETLDRGINEDGPSLAGGGGYGAHDSSGPTKDAHPREGIYENRVRPVRRGKGMECPRWTNGQGGCQDKGLHGAVASLSCESESGSVKMNQRELHVGPAIYSIDRYKNGDRARDCCGPGWWRRCRVRGAGISGAGKDRHV
jgi:hypothetical protein